MLIHIVSFLSNSHDASLYITEQRSVPLTPATSCATTGDIHSEMVISNSANGASPFGKEWEEVSQVNPLLGFRYNKHVIKVILQF